MTGPNLPPQDLSFSDVPGVRDLRCEGLEFTAGGPNRGSQSQADMGKSQFLSCGLSDL